MNRRNRKRPLIAFFDYSDVFEDFYPHFGVDQKSFATCWAGTANHAFVRLIQQEVGDVIWYSFSLNPQLNEARHEIMGCQVKMLRSSFLHRSLWRLFYLPKNAWRWQSFFPQYAALASYLSLLSFSFFKTIRRDCPDAFFIQDYATGRFDILLLISRLLGIPLIAYHSGSRPEKYAGKWAKYWSLPHAHRLLPSSQFEYDMLVNRYRVPKDHLSIILTPINTEVFQPIERKEACQALNLDINRRYLLFMGRLDDKVKKVSSIIKSFSELAKRNPNCDLLIAGEGPDKAVLESEASALKGRIHFLGWVSDAGQKALLYNAAECLILPSISEGFPTVIGEAMACGTPALASRVGGIPELVVENQTGWLIEPGDDGALTKKMGLILSQPEEISSMRKKIREKALARVSPSAVIQQMKQCFPTNGKNHE